MRRKDDHFEVLVLEDNDFDQAKMKRVFRQTGLTISMVIATDISEFEKALNASNFDVVFIDYTLPMGDGLLAQRILRQHPTNSSAAVVMISSNMQTDLAVASMKGGSLDCLDKDSISPDRIRDLLLVTNHPGRRAAKDQIAEMLAQQKAEISEEIKRVIRQELELSRFVEVIDSRLENVLSNHGLNMQPAPEVTPTLDPNAPFEFK